MLNAPSLSPRAAYSVLVTQCSASRMGSNSPPMIPTSSRVRVGAVLGIASLQSFRAPESLIWWS
jgi:hypothetical protein